jgi:hypothetical protein
MRNAVLTVLELRGTEYKIHHLHYLAPRSYHSPVLHQLRGDSLDQQT